MSSPASHRNAGSVRARFNSRRAAVLTSAVVGGLAVTLAAGAVPAGIGDIAFCNAQMRALAAEYGYLPDC